MITSVFESAVLHIVSVFREPTSSADEMCVWTMDGSPVESEIVADDVDSHLSSQHRFLLYRT